jgi:ribosome-binding factor A
MPRMEKVNELIKREIGHLILAGQISDPRVNFVTILSVEVSRDLQHAHVRFSTLSDKPADIQNAIEGLNSSRGYIRKLIGGRIELRYTPELKFVYDKGVEYRAQIDDKLLEIKNLRPETGEQDEGN